jgi:spermidine/putrescine transport system substrate-binding protein
MKLTRLAVALLATTTAATTVQAEGVLNIYNWGDYTNPDLIAKFEAAYDVKVTITDYDSNETALAKARLGSSGFDIAVPSQSHLPIWIAEGLLLETNPGQMENGKNIAPEWADPDFDPARKYSAPWQHGTIGIAVNTDVYKGPLDSWSIAFDPPEELKGKINVVPEMSDIIFAAIAYNGGELCASDEATLTKAHATLVAAKENWVAMEYGTIELMLAGDFAATIDWNGSAMRQRLENPAIAFVHPKEGVATWSDNVVVLAEAQNIENAKLFQNFIMDPENAALISAFARYSNGIAGSEAFMPEDMKDAPELTIPAHALENKVNMRICEPEVMDIYTKIWTDVLK